MSQFSRTNDDEVWSLFHENSKVSLLDSHPSDAAVVGRMQAMAEALAFRGCPLVPLPPPRQIGMGLTDAIQQRVSARSLTPDAISGEELSTLLQFCFGVSRDNADTQFPRPFRVAPSGGALYPIEPFLYCRSVADVPRGLYHFNAAASELRLIADHSEVRVLPASLRKVV